MLDLMLDLSFSPAEAKFLEYYVAGVTGLSQS
jgi:hypothetical protein